MKKSIDCLDLSCLSVYAIPLEDVYEFVMTVYPSESELKIIYKHNFILNEITEDGYYVFIKEE